MNNWIILVSLAVLIYVLFLRLDSMNQKYWECHCTFFNSMTISLSSLMQPYVYTSLCVAHVAIVAWRLQTQLKLCLWGNYSGEVATRVSIPSTGVTLEIICSIQCQPWINLNRYRLECCDWIYSFGYHIIYQYQVCVRDHAVSIFASPEH